MGLLGKAEACSVFPGTLPESDDTGLYDHKTHMGIVFLCQVNPSTIAFSLYSSGLQFL